MSSAAESTAAESTAARVRLITAETDGDAATLQVHCNAGSFKPVVTMTASTATVTTHPPGSSDFKLCFDATGGTMRMSAGPFANPPHRAGATPGPYTLAVNAGDYATRRNLRDTLCRTNVAAGSVAAGSARPAKRRRAASGSDDDGGSDDGDTHEVEAVTGARRRSGHREFLVKWVGYDTCSWVHERDMNCLSLICDFYDTAVGDINARLVAARAAGSA